MNKIVRSICLGFLAIAMQLPLSAQARNLIAIIAADTRDSRVGTSVTEDFKHMRARLQEVANYTNMTLKEITFTGKNTNAATILQKLHNADIQKDDVVVFYYAGHGYRTTAKGSSPWPNLAFSTSFEGLEYETIMTELSNKHPHFLLTLVDICNNVIPEDVAPPVINAQRIKRAEAPTLAKNYSALFNNISGTVFIASSSVGEFALGFKDGGLYTNAFLKSLDTEVSKTKSAAKWQNILKNAYDIAANPQSEDIEHPYSEVHIN